MNIIEPILFQCKLNPLTTAICTPGSAIESVNYGQLERFIHNVARNALKAGLAPSQRIGIFISENILHGALAFGLMRLGIATVSLRQPQCPKEISLDAIFTDRPQSFAGQTVNLIRIDPSWLEGDGNAPDYDRIHWTNEDDLCRVILTSGSTGRAKGVPFSHRELMNRIQHYAYSKGPRFAHCPRFFCDLGIATSPGFRYALSLLGRGGTIYFLGSEPADILQIIDLHKIQGMATSPYGLGEFMKFFEADPAFEVTFDHIICQGAMLSQELSRRARARMCSNLYSSYGSTETTTVAFGPATMTEGIAGGVDGLIRIRSPHMAKGYVGDPDATKVFFRHGCFYSGDIGHLSEHGMLVITGREKTALNIGGDIISPEIVEEVLTSFPGIEDAAVLAIPNELGVSELHALVVAKPTSTMTALRNYCSGKLALHHIPVRFIPAQSIPRGAQGKIERHRLEDCVKSAMPN
jgi:acyl-CoA synthetase (AMP-forming)/AMP-acid ligase II